MRWWQGPLIVLVGAAVLAVGAWWGVARDDGETDAPARAPVRLDVGEVLDLVPGCRRDTCRVVDRRDGFRYDDQRVVMLVVEEPGDCGPLAPARVHLVDARGARWSGPDDVVCGDPIGGVDVDATGNAFLAFPAAEGHTKLVVLDVAGDAVRDFDSFDGRFEGARVVTDDLDGDGAYEIVVGSGSQARVFRWTGRDYAQRS